jgi:hypothetical protein
VQPDRNDRLKKGARAKKGHAKNTAYPPEFKYPKQTLNDKTVWK